jgi:two-component sensor histidine kinase
MPTLLVSHEPSSAARVRKALLADLRAHDVEPESVEEVVLVASEIVCNAVLHTDPAPEQDLTVSWQISDESAVVQVSDPSSEQPVRRHVEVDEPGGRGLTIVDTLASQWGTDKNPVGKRVWARVPLRHK